MCLDDFYDVDQDMRVGHFRETFSLLSETFIYDYVIKTNDQGVESHVFCFERLNADSRPFDNVHVIEQVPALHPSRLIGRFKTKLGLGGNDRPLWPELRRRVARRFAEIRPDVVHAHFGTAGAFIAPVSERLRIPLVVSFHGVDAFRFPFEPEWSGSIRAMLRCASHVTAVSEYMRDHLISIGAAPDRTSVVHVGKDVRSYEFRREPAWPIKRWLSIGRIVEKKGFVDCIEAFRLHLQQVPDATLTIIGPDGGKLENLRQRISTHGLEKQVELTGPLPHDEVKRRLYDADAFILCSKTSSLGDKEGIPTVLMEALAVGLPCVATRHSGIPELFPNENHWLLAEEANPVDIVSKMDSLVQCSAPELKLITRRGREAIEIDFNLAHETGKLVDIYRKALSNSVKERKHKRAFLPIRPR